MSETAATHLARLRVQYGSRFRIERNEGRFTARERLRTDDQRQQPRRA
jgi:hypothetical protein